VRDCTVAVSLHAQIALGFVSSNICHLWCANCKCRTLNDLKEKIRRVSTVSDKRKSTGEADKSGKPGGKKGSS
jgi:hypothetical protein